MGFTLRKAVVVVGGTAVGGAVCFVTAGAAAPAVGAFIGSTFMGLSGAAATSAGLAALGGGSLAAGGGGMAAGAALVTTSLTGAGAVLGTLGAGTLANLLDDEGRSFREALDQQGDVAKAQRILMEHERRIRLLQMQLDVERARQQTDQARIAELEETLVRFEAVLQAERRALGQGA